MATIAYADAWYSAISILPVKSQPTLRLVVGISNSFLPQGAAAVAHRQAWAKMVANISSVIASRPYAHLVSVVGGMEMEIGFSGPARVAPWVQGYGPGPRADFGDAALCPNKNCGNGWTPDLIISLGGSIFLPEIYGDSGGNAVEWAALSSYNLATNGAPLNIVAPISQITA